MHSYHKRRRNPRRDRIPPELPLFLVLALLLILFILAGYIEPADFN